MRKSIPFFILLIALIIPIAFAKQASMPLLAIKETNEGYKGSTAELLLEVKEGTGRVFVDTFPLSRIDTQFSMRFAKEIACDFLNYNCDGYDFVYTIKADSPIIGGPSAGAAAAVLTILVLSDSPAKEGTAMTGTINSGGLIGPVGGLKEKLKAAADKGIKIVLIPQGEKNEINDTNSSLSLEDYGSSINIKVVEVADIYSSLKYFTDRKFQTEVGKIIISSEYTETMKKLASQLCDRNSELKKSITIGNSSEVITNLYQDALNLSMKGEEALKNSQFYSSASFCFGSNVKLNQAFLETKNFSVEKYKALLDELKKDIKKYENQIDKKEIKTITDLESYMVVKERLVEAMEYSDYSKNDSLSYAYSYAYERLKSAYSWAEFLDHKGKEFIFNDESLKESCKQRIAESEERLQYASLYIPFSLTSPREELNEAYKDFNNQSYALCLFKASISKAESNIILNTLGIETEFIPNLIENKLNAASRVIVKAEKKDMFPILGYSYYEYANNLKESDKFSALLYAEYALELSNLDMYFKEKEKIIPLKIDYIKISILITGIAIGFLLGIIIGRLSKKANKRKKRLKRL